jgi:hypothetical protein
MQTQPSLHPKLDSTQGIQLANESETSCRIFLREHGLLQDALVEHFKGITHCRVRPEWASSFAPDFNTLGFQDCAQNLTQEILYSLLISPHLFKFKDLEALASAVRVRENIVKAARKTALAFRTEAAERPVEYWRYVEEAGFILQPGTCLINALISATQPEATGKLYDFSCYRATEYVILLGLAQEAQRHRPDLLKALQQLNEVHAIRSGQFHDVFLSEYGSLETPLPARYFVPGDRLWFRNPDEASSDVTGYEGSWVIYMGGGLFSNFWKRDQPYTLETKCVEIYHWRDGLRINSEGDAWIDESIVEACVQSTLADPKKLGHVLQLMMRMRDGKGIYATGGCLDASRERPQQVSTGDCELNLPDMR